MMSIETEILGREAELTARHQQDRLDLSITTAEYIVDELNGVTRNIGLYTVALYAAHGPVEKQVAWFEGLTTKLDEVRAGEIFATTRGVTAEVMSAYRAPETLPEDGLWRFEVRSPYVNKANDRPNFEGDLLLDISVAVGRPAFFPRTLSKKSLNHGREGSHDEPYCEGITVGLANILAGGLSEKEAAALAGLVS